MARKGESMRDNMTEQEILALHDDLNQRYAESEAWHEAQNTGHVRFEYRLWPDDAAKWSSQYPEVFRRLEACISDGDLQEHGGHYTVETNPLRAEQSGEVVFSADRTGLIAEVDFHCNWREPHEAASHLAAVSGIWDPNEDDGPSEDAIDKLAAALVERVPGSSAQFLNGPCIAVRLSFGDEPVIDDVFTKLNSLEYELCEQDYRAWSSIKAFAKDFLSSLK